MYDLHMPPESAAADDLDKEQVIEQRRINHAGPVCHSSYNPFNPFFVATATVSGDALVFNVQNHPLRPVPDGKCRPDACLSAHVATCRSISWSPHKEGILLSGSVDSRLVLWDIIDVHNPPTHPTKYLRGPSSIKPLQTFQKTHGSDGAYAARFHPEHQYVFASTG
jgi:histone-binding protein RBBP4